MRGLLAGFALVLVTRTAFAQVPAMAAPGEPSLAPYGPGTPVQLTASGEPVTVYVVHHVAGAPRPDDFEFAKVGKTPITIQLPNGSYLIESEGYDSTRGSFDLTVDGQARQLLIENGAQSTHTLGNLTTGVGIAALLGGIVVLVGGSLSKSSTIDKPAIVIPLFASGGVLIATGVTLTIVSRTDVLDTSPGRLRDGQPRGAPTSASIRLTWQF